MWKELTIPKVSVFLFLHDIIVKEKVALQNFINEKVTLQNFCRGQKGIETCVNDLNGINNKPFYRTILKIAVGWHENIRKCFHNKFVCFI